MHNVLIVIYEVYLEETELQPFVDVFGRHLAILLFFLNTYYFLFPSPCPYVTLNVTFLSPSVLNELYIESLHFV